MVPIVRIVKNSHSDGDNNPMPAYLNFNRLEKFSSHESQLAQSCILHVNTADDCLGNVVQNETKVTSSQFHIFLRASHKTQTMISTKRVSFQETVDVQHIETHHKVPSSKLFYQAEDYSMFQKRERGRLQRAYGRASGHVDATTSLHRAMKHILQQQHTRQV